MVEAGVALSCRQSPRPHAERQQRVSDCSGGALRFVHTTPPFRSTTKGGTCVMGCHFMRKLLPDLWPSSHRDKDPVLRRSQTCRIDTSTGPWGFSSCTLRDWWSHLGWGLILLSLSRSPVTSDFLYFFSKLVICFAVFRYCPRCRDCSVSGNV